MITENHKIDLNTPNIRYHYMDNLRALAMLLGVVFHASLAYSPMMHFFWLTADQQSEAIDVFAWFTHLFRMPLFFLIAGFFSVYLIQKRGLTRFLMNRGLRVLLPFLIFLPLVLWAIIAAITWAGVHIEKPSPALYFILNSMNSEVAANQPINTSHLWFLYYLCFFYLVLLVMWMLKIIQSTALSSFMRPWVVVVIIPLILIPVFYHLPAPHPAPETLMPLLWPFALYGLFFLFGALLFKHQSLIKSLDRHLLWMLAAGIGSYVYVAYRMPAAYGTLLMAIAESFTAWYMTLSCLIMGHKWLNQKQQVVRYIADSSYWIYLIHIPVLFMVQFVFLDIQWNLWVEFLLSTLITFAIGISSYALLVRWTPIGWLLNGKRTKTKPQLPTQSEQ
ncbi:MAG: acyltransferase family protein [Marinicella sp.]